VTAGAAGWPLPGNLTMPVGDGPFPAVVLVHGSGPQDRDASIGPNKLFRDIAFGLATNGVAVLRYEKRSREHAARLNENLRITVREEAIDDVLAGVALLRRSARIDPTRVFVLGHSLGGMLAPRILEADPTLAGAVVLAGAVRPIERSIIEQTRYLLVADGQLTDDERDQLMAVERLAASVRALTPDDVGKPVSTGGAPASYWLDLRGYDPPALASRLASPFLILQGERDYQVTMADFARWRAALESRANVTLTSYPALNHMFMAGAGPSLPSEYLAPGHVDAQVVADIARWITTTVRQP
jgi:dienelactone hydrolase